MKIRRIEKNDLPKLYELYCQLVGPDGSYENMCKVFEEIRNNPIYLLVGVYEKDELIATASLTKCFDMTGDARYYYSMENFVVDKKHRRCGVGRFLMTYLEEYVKENNGCYINFTSSVARKNAHEFYHSLGYKEDYVKGFKKVF